MRRILFAAGNICVIEVENRFFTSCTIHFAKMAASAGNKIIATDFEVGDSFVVLKMRPIRFVSIAAVSNVDHVLNDLGFFISFCIHS